MKKIMTARELFNYIRTFETIRASMGDELNGFFTFIEVGELKIDELNHSQRIYGKVMKHPKKRDGSFSISGEQFECDIVEENETNHIVTVTSDTMPFPVTLDLQR